MTDTAKRYALPAKIMARADSQPVEDQHGEWVKYNDYRTILAAKEAAEAERDEAQLENEYLRQEYTALETERDQLREQYNHDRGTVKAAVDAAEAAEAREREAVMQSLAHLGQAEEAWEAQKKAEAEARRDAEIREQAENTLALADDQRREWERHCKVAEAEAAALREKLRDRIKHLHAQLPYFNVPHIREGLEDMLDVIGPMEGDNDE